MKLVALVLALAACGSARKDQETLAESIRSFNDGVRWERFAMAASQLPPQQRGEFVDQMDERAEDLKITDYEVVRVEPTGPREAKVQVKLSWYRSSEGLLRETHAMQTWERVGKAWLMVDSSRVRGAEMPGLPDSD